MPETIRLMYWNVQDLGTRSPARRGDDYQPICNFIGGFAAANDVDLFCMMESRQAFVPYLDTLMFAFDAAFASAGKAGDWRYDWIPGCIKGDVK
jgi:hypothetical protein